MWNFRLFICTTHIVNLDKCRYGRFTLFRDEKILVNNVYADEKPSVGTVTDPRFRDYRYSDAQMAVKKNQKNPEKKISPVNYEALEAFYNFQDEILKKRQNIMRTHALMDRTYNQLKKEQFAWALTIVSK